MGIKDKHLFHKYRKDYTAEDILPGMGNNSRF